MTSLPCFLWFVPDDSFPVHSGIEAHRSFAYSRWQNRKSTATPIFISETGRYPVAPKLAPRFNETLKAVHERQSAKGHANRATLAVARKLVAYLLAVDRAYFAGQQPS